VSIAAIVVILTLVASAMVLTSGGAKSGSASGTPGAAVEAWASAVKAGNYTEADSYVSDNFLNRHGSTARVMSYMTITDISIASTTTTSSGATVRATVTLGLAGSTDTGYPGTWTFIMVRNAGPWKIDDISGQVVP
jgi:hypothetical protein